MFLGPLCCWSMIQILWQVDAPKDSCLLILMPLCNPLLLSVGCT